MEETTKKRGSDESIADEESETKSQKVETEKVSKNALRKQRKIKIKQEKKLQKGTRPDSK